MKICPMKCTRSDYCEGKECEWWIPLGIPEGGGRCAVALIAIYTDKIREELECVVNVVSSLGIK